MHSTRQDDSAGAVEGKRVERVEGERAEKVKRMEASWNNNVEASRREMK